MQWIDSASDRAGRELPPRLLEHSDQPLALFVDIDGTLVDFARRPNEVRLDPDLVCMLARLQHLLGGAVAVLSGRDLADVDRLLNPLKLPAGALHGLQCRDASGRVRSLLPPASAATRVGRECELLAESLPGVWIERKAKVAFALHFRDAPEHGPTVLGAAASIADRSSGRYKLQPGNCVAELKPAGADKGDALASLLQSAPFRGRAPLVLGDDLTDEPAFAMAEKLGGAGVIVGARRPTLARHSLNSPRHTGRWLAALATRLEQARLESSPWRGAERAWP
jgi:trehalose 6-phosphate phosphatase